MTLKQLMSQLESLGDPKVRAQHIKRGAGENVFGLKLGDIRKLAAKFKGNHDLGLQLWSTGNMDAMLLGILLLKPAKLSRDELDAMVRAADVPQIADWLNAYVVKEHADKEYLRQQWMTSDNPWAARAGWNLTSSRIARSPDGLDIPALLDRIEAELVKADPAEQWTMNNCLAGIGIHMAKYRQRALEIGERLGVYRDFPVSKGCTSPFAPIWINEMVSRQS